MLQEVRGSFNSGPFDSAGDGEKGFRGLREGITVIEPKGALEIRLPWREGATPLLRSQDSKMVHELLILLPPVLNAEISGVWAATYLLHYYNVTIRVQFPIAVVNTGTKCWDLCNNGEDLAQERISASCPTLCLWLTVLTHYVSFVPFLRSTVKCNTQPRALVKRVMWLQGKPFLALPFFPPELWLESRLSGYWPLSPELWQHVSSTWQVWCDVELNVPFQPFLQGVQVNLCSLAHFTDFIR